MNDSISTKSIGLSLSLSRASSKLTGERGFLVPGTAGRAGVGSGTGRGSYPLYPLKRTCAVH